MRRGGAADKPATHPLHALPPSPPTHPSPPPQDATARSLSPSPAPPAEPSFSCSLNHADLYDLPLLRVTTALLLAQPQPQPQEQLPAWGPALALASKEGLDAGVAAALCGLVTAAVGASGAAQGAATATAVLEASASLEDACLGLVWAWGRLSAASAAAAAAGAGAAWAALPFAGAGADLRAAAAAGLRGLAEDAAACAARLARPSGLRLQPVPRDNPFVKALLALVAAPPPAKGAPALGLSDEDVTYTCAAGSAAAADEAASTESDDDAFWSDDEEDGEGSGEAAFALGAPQGCPLSEADTAAQLALCDAYLGDDRPSAVLEDKYRYKYWKRTGETYDMRGPKPRHISQRVWNRFLGQLQRKQRDDEKVRGWLAGCGKSLRTRSAVRGWGLA